jgi:hypothetical protein
MIGRVSNTIWITLYGVSNFLQAEEYPGLDLNEMIETTLHLLQEYDITFENRCRIFVDGANPSFIRAFKARISRQDENYENLIAHLKTSYGANFGLHSLVYNMFVVPFHFSKEHKNMLAHTKRMLEYGNGAIAINPQFNKLITSLRTAVEKGDGSLDKDATSRDDLLDGFRLSLQFWR